MPAVNAGVTRIFSDMHYGDRASAVHSLAQLRPLLDGPAALVLNGDTLDTRHGPHPAVTAALREETREFFAAHAPHAQFLTGNHDPDISATHALEAADGKIFITHGDILFDDIVPWSRVAGLARARIAHGLAALAPGERATLAARLAVWRHVAASIPQHHQVERDALKYIQSFLRDTVWPPTRPLRILRAWREAPARAAALVRAHRLPARFFVMGHTHRPGAWRTRDGVVLLNTGSFCPPLGCACADVTAEKITLRRITRRGGEFHPGAVLAEFALATE